MIHDDIIMLMASTLKARLWSEYHIILGIDTDKVAKILEDAMPQEFEIKVIDEEEKHVPVDLSKKWTGNKKQDE